MTTIVRNATNRIAGTVRGLGTTARNFGTNMRGSTRMEHLAAMQKENNNQWKQFNPATTPEEPEPAAYTATQDVTEPNRFNITHNTGQHQNQDRTPDKHNRAENTAQLNQGIAMQTKPWQPAKNSTLPLAGTKQRDFSTNAYQPETALEKAKYHLKALEAQKWADTELEFLALRNAANGSNSELVNESCAALRAFRKGNIDNLRLQVRQLENTLNSCEQFDTKVIAVLPKQLELKWEIVVAYAANDPWEITQALGNLQEFRNFQKKCQDALDETNGFGNNRSFSTQAGSDTVVNQHSTRDKSNNAATIDDAYEKTLAALQSPTNNEEVNNGTNAHATLRDANGGTANKSTHVDTLKHTRAQGTLRSAGC